MGKFDEIFDDVVVNAKAAVSAVSKKASGMYDTSRQKITAAELRSAINKKLRELGAITYKLRTGAIDSSEDKTEALIEEINDLKETLDTINQNIASAANQRKCISCGSTVPKNSLFCNICGAKLGETETDEFVEAEESVKAEEPAEPVQTDDDFSEIAVDDEQEQ